MWAMSTLPKGGLDWSVNEIGQVGGGVRGSFAHTLHVAFCIVALAGLSSTVIVVLCSCVL